MIKGYKKKAEIAGMEVLKNFKILENHTILVQENQVEFQKYLDDIREDQKKLNKKLNELYTDVQELLNEIKK